MEDWKDWRNTFRHYISTDISCPTKLSEEYKCSNHQIKLFSELCRSDIAYNDCINMIRQTILATFNYIYDQRLKFDEHTGKHKYNIGLHNYNTIR